MHQKYPKVSRNICDHPFYTPFLLLTYTYIPYIYIHTATFCVSLCINKTNIHIYFYWGLGEMDVSASFSLSNDNGSNGSEQGPHVLAVDDSVVDRSLLFLVPEVVGHSLLCQRKRENTLFLPCPRLLKPQ